MDPVDSPSRGPKRRRTNTYASRRTTLNSPSPNHGLDTVEQTQPDLSQENLINHHHQTTRLQTESEASSAVNINSASSRRSSRRLKHGPDVETTTGPSSTPPPSAPPPKQSTKRGKTNTAGAQAQDPGEVTTLANAVAGAHPNTHADLPPAAGGGDVPLRSSGRKRRPPHRLSGDLDPVDRPHMEPLDRGTPSGSPVPNAKAGERDSAAAQPLKPKGILTPSRKSGDRTKRSRKSVVFDPAERESENELGFKDIDPSIQRSTRRETHRGGEASTDQQVGRRHGWHATSDGLHQAPGATPKAVAEDEDEQYLVMTPNVDEILSASRQLPPADAAPLETDKDDASLTKIKEQVLGRLVKQMAAPFAHLQHQYDTIHAMLAATITTGESNSILLLGARGSGKSHLVSHALADLARSHGDDFHVVRLNGFFQTDDKVALREIWRQLGREMAVPDVEIGEVSSYADTLASLLSLLSHPEELTQQDLAEADHEKREAPGDRVSQSIIFILDEFDLFTTHPRQTLLYNLFDIAQAKKAPIAVIGCSTRMDVVDCLEKRVKSRFSHRWLHIPTPQSVAALEDAVSHVLCLPTEGKDALGVAAADMDQRLRWNHAIQTEFLALPANRALMKRCMFSTKSIPDVLAALYLPIATVSAQTESFTWHDDTRPAAAQEYGACGVDSAPSLLSLLPHLPTLHMSLLVSAARLETIHNIVTLNFALVYAQYADLLVRAKMERSTVSTSTSGGSVTGTALRKWTKDIARGAWEELVAWELLVPVSGLSGAGKQGDDEYSSEAAGSKMFRVDVTLDELSWAIKEKFGSVATGEVLYKWSTEV